MERTSVATLLVGVPPSKAVGAIIDAQPLRVVHKLDGRGDILDGDRVVADVDYTLRDVEEKPGFSPPTVDVTGTPDGRRNVYGIVLAPEPGTLAEYQGARLTLRLEDGRLLPCTISKVLAPHRFLLQGLGCVSA